MCSAAWWGRVAMRLWPWGSEAHGRRRAVLAFATALAIVSAQPQAAWTDETKLRDLFAATIPDAQLAYAVTLLQGDQPPASLVQGLRFKGAEQTVSAESLWHIGSITKSFTAVLVLQLADEGRLDLDTPIGTYLSAHIAEMNSEWSNRTLRELLSHTSGLRANASTLDQLRTWPSDQTDARRDVLARHWSEPLSGMPGTYLYSNLGYVLAGFVAETVAGESWETLIERRIAAPLGLTSLGFGPPVTLASAWGHSSLLGVLRPVNPRRATSADNPAWMAPAGGLHMTIADLAAWGRFHVEACAGRRPHVLSAERCLEMRNVVQEGYGLGWILQTHPQTNGPIVLHNGSNTLWYAVLAIMPDDEAVVAIAHNTGRGRNVEVLARALVNAVMVGE